MAPPGQALLACAIALAQASAANAASDYSPLVRANHPNRVFFGDTRLHTRRLPMIGASVTSGSMVSPAPSPESRR